jgi:hypothetical protein
MTTALPLNAKVRFTQERLSVLTPRDRQGLAGRVGVIQTDGNLTRKPTVYFSADETRLDIRLFRVDPRHLELVESPPQAEQEPTQDDDATDSTPTKEVDKTAAAQASEPEGGGKLSQSEMDDLFG